MSFPTPMCLTSHARFVFRRRMTRHCPNILEWCEVQQLCPVSVKHFFLASVIVVRVFHTPSPITVYHHWLLPGVRYRSLLPHALLYSILSPSVFAPCFFCWFFCALTFACSLSLLRSVQIPGIVWPRCRTVVDHASGVEGCILTLGALHVAVYF